MDYVVVEPAELQGSPLTREFEGYAHGGVGASFIVVDMAPGAGVSLHRHPYAEIFVVQEGRATFTAGAATREVRAGQTVVVNAGTAHKFVNTGEQQLRQVDIHLSDRFITEWLED